MVQIKTKIPPKKKNLTPRLIFVYEIKKKTEYSVRCEVALILCVFCDPSLRLRPSPLPASESLSQNIKLSLLTAS